MNTLQQFVNKVNRQFVCCLRTTYNSLEMFIRPTVQSKNKCNSKIEQHNIKN